MIAIAREYKRGLRVLFVVVVVLVLAFFAADYLWPLNTGDTWAWPMTYASLPWSAAGFAVPHPLFAVVAIAVGLGINSVAAAIVFLWWIKTLRAGNDA